VSLNDRYCVQQATTVAWEKKGKITRRERFLAEMDAVIPWARVLALIEPHYPKAL
jgi:IS5 family transposase